MTTILLWWILCELEAPFWTFIILAIRLLLRLFED